MSSIVVQPEKEKCAHIYTLQLLPFFSTASVRDDKNKLWVRWTCVGLNVNGALHIRNQHDWLEHLITSVSGEL